jgi:hypothetical protein
MHHGPTSATINSFSSEATLYAAFVADVIVTLYSIINLITNYGYFVFSHMYTEALN